MSQPLDHLRAFWDERYATEAYAYGTAPNSFLVTHAPPLRPGDEVLCLADGEGRNGVWLATQGARVTSLDVSPAGVAKAQRLAREAGVALQAMVADVTTAELGEARWDLIVSIFLHLPPGPRQALHRRCLRALKPGGRFIYEAYGAGQLGRGTGGPKEPALLPTLAEVEADFAGVPGCTVRHRFQGVRAVHEGPLHSGYGEVVQLVIERAAP
jgi:SAM-dependent methyltransferase